MNGANQSKGVTLNIPMVPPSPNLLRRKYKNYHAYGRLRDEWQRAIYYSLDHNLRSWLEAMAKLGKKMSVKVTLQHKRLYDPDNLTGSLKPLLDSLVRLKLLANDDNDHIGLTVDQEQINASSTRIEICEAK